MRSLVVLCLLAPLATARPLPLRHHAGTDYAIDVPKGWTLEEPDDAQGTLVAKENATRRDAAILVVTVKPVTKVTADAILDLLLKHFIKQATNVRRGSRGAARYWVADGIFHPQREDVRMGTIAVISKGRALVVSLVTRRDRFDALGGIDTANAVLTSIGRFR